MAAKKRKENDGYVDRIEARRGTDSSDKRLRELKPIIGQSSSEFGDYMRRLADHRVLTKAEEQELSRRLLAGDQKAKQQLILHNTRLVVSIVKRYSQLDFDFEDMVQEGIIGLNRAAEKFDPDKGFKFSTYATWWVRQALQRYMQTHGTTIRVPAHLQDSKRKILRYQRENPSASLAEAAEACEVTPIQALDAMEGPRIVASLDATIGDDGGDEGRHALIADDDAPDPHELVVEDASRLRSAMAELPELQRKVLEMRFGFDGPVMGRDAIAEELGYKNPYVVQDAQKRGLAALARELGDNVEEDSSPAAGGDEAVFSSFRRLDTPPAGPVCTRKRKK